MARRQPRVVAVGDAIVDLVTPPLPPIPPGDFQGHVFGVDALPGGNATNFALAIASLGARTRFVGAIGADPNGAVLRDAYRRHGVRAILRVDSRRPTGATMALTWSAGGRALITALGANASLVLRDVPSRLLEGSDHLHRSGFWWTQRLIGRPTSLLLARARRRGLTTSLDVSTDPHGWPEDRIAAVRACLPNVTTFFGSEVEVCAVAGRSSPIEAADHLRSLGPEEVVVHQADRGATVVHRAGRITSAAFCVPIDNPTGCGDVFNAAYVYARLGGAGLPEALRFGNAAAALHLRDRRRPYPTDAAVRRLARTSTRP